MKHEFQSSILCNESEFPTYPRPSSAAPSRSAVKRNLNWSFVDGGSLTNTVKVSAMQTTGSIWLIHGILSLHHATPKWYADTSVHIWCNCKSDNQQLNEQFAHSFSELISAVVNTHTHTAFNEFFRSVIKWCANFTILSPLFCCHLNVALSERPVVSSIFSFAALGDNPDSNLFPRALHLVRFNWMRWLHELNVSDSQQYHINVTTRLKRWELRWRKKWQWNREEAKGKETRIKAEPCIPVFNKYKQCSCSLDIQYITGIHPSIVYCTAFVLYFCFRSSGKKLHCKHSYIQKPFRGVQFQNFYYSNNFVPMICTLSSSK